MSKGIKYDGDLNRFFKWVAILKNKKESFQTKQYGSCAKIIYSDGTQWVFFEKKKDSESANYATICSMTSRDAKKYISSNKPTEIKHSPISEPNPSTIKTFINLPEEKCYFRAIDLIACYWNIAYKKGFILKKTYNKGLKLKHERNVALGSLNKYITEINYISGNKISEQSYNADTSVIWNEIIKEVGDIYEKIISLIGLENYIGWETDCIYFKDEDKKVVDRVINFLNNKNIEFNSYSCYFTEITNSEAKFIICNCNGGKEKSFFIYQR